MSNSLSPSAQPLPAAQRSESVVMGNQSFLRVLLRSTAGELYKIQRRAMSKVLLLIGIVIVIVSFSFIALTFFVTSSTRCAPDDNGQTQNCVQSSGFTPSAMALAAPLHLPASLTTTVSIIDVVGLVLLVILAGTVVGGDYGVGTIRMLLTRGPTRTQYLLAKILALLVCIAMAMIILIPIGIIVGALYNLSTGIGVDFSFFTGDWVLHAIIYILLEMLKLFIYTIIALSLATLGRSVAAGVAGAIVLWFLEGLLGSILMAVSLATPGKTGDILRAIPDYFVGNNINVLLAEQSSFLTLAGKKASFDSTVTIPDWRALLVIALYLVVFLGITWWVSERRDITN